MNDAQLIVEVRDQFALKGLSDDALRKILPAYELALERIRDMLADLPDGEIARELWLKSQMATIEQQFRVVTDRIYTVLPESQAVAVQEAMDNAADFLKADNIQPNPPGPQESIFPTYTNEALITDENLAGEFIRPSITRQQIDAASKQNGFSIFNLAPKTDANGNVIHDGMVILDDVLPATRKAMARSIENTLRTGFLMGESNDQIVRRIGRLGGGRKGWAMTETLVRTGMKEASQAAHDAFFAANEELLPKVPGGYRWEWDASNDTRVCYLCAPLDGLRYKTREEMPPRPHWGCRCSMLPITSTEAQMRADNDLPKGSYLERREVTYTDGKRNDPPKGWDGRRVGGRKVNENAYAQPKRQGYKIVNGKKKPQMYWVRRRELPKGRNTAGDMLQAMGKSGNFDSQLAIFRNRAEVDRFNILTLNGGKYENNPQAAVRLLLSGKAGLPAGTAGPMKPAGRRQRR